MTLRIPLVWKLETPISTQSSESLPTSMLSTYIGNTNGVSCIRYGRHVVQLLDIAIAIACMEYRMSLASKRDELLTRSEELVRGAKDDGGCSRRRCNRERIIEGGMDSFQTYELQRTCPKKC